MFGNDLMKIQHLALIALCVSALSLSQASDEASKPSLNCVNFEQVMVLDEAGDSYIPLPPAGERPSLHHIVTEHVRQGNYADAIEAALRAQDPLVRCRLCLGIINHLCHEENYGMALDIASYRLPSQDIKALSLLMVAVKQAEQNMKAAPVTYEKALHAAEAIEDEASRTAVLDFVRNTHLPHRQL